MGRCGSCRTQTQRFCFVHQEFVCDGCLVSDESRIHARCVIGTYREWVLDNSYEWPPKCSRCSVELEADGDFMRRACMHLECASCLEASSPPDHPCGACNAPLRDSLDSSDIGKAMRNRIRTMPSLQVLLADAEAVEPEVEEDSASPTAIRDQNASESRTSAPSVTQSESVRTQYKRQTASLQIIETDLAQNVSQVSPEVNEQPQEVLQIPSHNPPKPKTETRLNVQNVSQVSPEVNEQPQDVHQIPSQNPPKLKTETRLNVGPPKLHSLANDSSSRQSVPSKRERSSSRSVATASVRKALKAGTRRWFDLRKFLFGNQKQVLVIFMFVVCVVLVGILMSGDDREDSNLIAASKPAVEEEDINLPHVRINPAFRSAGFQRGVGDNKFEDSSED